MNNTHGSESMQKMEKEKGKSALNLLVVMDSNLVVILSTKCGTGLLWGTGF